MCVARQCTGLLAALSARRDARPWQLSQSGEIYCQYLLYPVRSGSVPTVVLLQRTLCTMCTTYTHGQQQHIRWVDVILYFYNQRSKANIQTSMPYTVPAYQVSGAVLDRQLARHATGNHQAKRDKRRCEDKVVQVGSDVLMYLARVVRIAYNAIFCFCHSFFCVLLMAKLDDLR